MVFARSSVFSIGLAMMAFLVITHATLAAQLAKEPVPSSAQRVDKADLGGGQQSFRLAPEPGPFAVSASPVLTDTSRDENLSQDVLVDSSAAVPSDDVNVTYIPGQSYWGRNQYIEYVAGDLPIIISAPHGGFLEPAEIPDRTWGSKGQDTYSQEYTQKTAEYITQLTGGYPHVIINHLHRDKLDANRDIGEAAQGNPYAEQAWTEYHGFIDDAKALVVARYGHGHYFDFHTNGHDDQWVEFGYLLTSSDLNRSDAELDSSYYMSKTSLKSLAYTPGVYFPGVIRGSISLGGLLQARGYKAVPSPLYPDPDGGGFYSGGYNTLYHGSRFGGTVDGTQVETYWGFAQPGMRDAYSRSLAESIVTFVDVYYGFELREWPYQFHIPMIVNRH